MHPLFKKLNLKEQRDVVVLNAPASCAGVTDALADNDPPVQVHRTADAVASVQFALTFVTTLDDIARAAETLVPRAPGDPVLWFAYPKQSSKRYRCDFNRDTGWTALGDAGFEGVRQVAIDEDWSALRFRRVEHIASFTRDAARAASPAGKARAASPAGKARATRESSPND